jgi:hypothetical protein
MTGGKANSLSAHSPTRGTRADPLSVGYVPDGKVFSGISSLPSSLSANEVPSSAHYKDVGVRVASFRSSIAHPTYSPVYASPCTSRCPTQNSRPSGSLLLTRKNFAFSASCRFTPAHCNRDFSTTKMGSKSCGATPKFICRSTKRPKTGNRFKPL